MAIGRDFLGREFLLGMVILLIFVRNGETAKRIYPPGSNYARMETGSVGISHDLSTEPIAYRINRK